MVDVSTSDVETVPDVVVVPVVVVVVFVVGDVVVVVVAGVVATAAKATGGTVTAPVNAMGLSKFIMEGSFDFPGVDDVAMSDWNEKLRWTWSVFVCVFVCLCNQMQTYSRIRVGQLYP
jgi:hypothetical protein